MHFRRETVGEGEKGMGSKGGEGQYTANQGSERTGIRATTQRRDFQVSKGRVPRNKGRDFQATKRDYQKDWACTPVYISS
jgi:hypothetical protein